MNEITLTTCARAMSMNLSACHSLVYGSSRITPATAVRLSSVLGGTPGHGLKMQNDYEVLQIKGDKRSLSRRAYPVIVSLPMSNRDLVVRITGYSTFFSALSTDTQDDIITHTEQVL